MADESRKGDEGPDDEARGQPERVWEDVRDRAGEDEPKHGDRAEQLGALDDALESHDYPTTTNDLVEAYGDYPIETKDGETPLAEVLAPTEDQTYESADDVRSRILGLIHR